MRPPSGGLTYIKGAGLIGQAGDYIYMMIPKNTRFVKEDKKMESRVTELRDKEIINISDGCRFGYVGDVEVDLETGQVKALVVPGRLRFFGLLGREEDKVFPWESVRRFGEDIILVEAAEAHSRRLQAGAR